jgi:hypothetical protein
LNIEIISSVLATVQGHFFLPVLRLKPVGKVKVKKVDHLPDRPGPVQDQ